MSGAVNDPAAAAAKATGGIPLQEASVDCSKLNALSPEVIARQATVSWLWLLVETKLIDRSTSVLLVTSHIDSPSRFWSYYYSIQE
jgi:hypothetical protein